MISEESLIQKYLNSCKSVHEIATELSCSDSKVTYWLKKYNIPRRSISDAVYVKSNPKGDPFLFSPPVSPEECFLFGLGLGLYWGEGNKANKHAVRLGNTDPDLILKFLEFLDKIYQIDKQKLSFGLQIFSDVSKTKALNFWINKLGVPVDKFQKVIVTKSTKSGTYGKKNVNGVLTIYFSNIKLRDIIVGAIEDLKK